MKSGWKFAAVSAVMTGAVIGGVADAAAAEPPMVPEQGQAPADRGGGWPTVPSGSPSGSESPSSEPSESSGSQVGIVGVAALGAGLIPLGAWVWRRQRNRREAQG